MSHNPDCFPGGIDPGVGTIVGGDCGPGGGFCVFCGGLIGFSCGLNVGVGTIVGGNCEPGGTLIVLSGGPGKAVGAAFLTAGVNADAVAAGGVAGGCVCVGIGATGPAVAFAEGAAKGVSVDGFVAPPTGATAAAVAEVGETVTGNDAISSMLSNASAGNGRGLISVDT